MTRVASYTSPTDPVAKAAALERNARNGWSMQPGASDIESGFILRADDPSAPLWAPPVPTPPVRTSAAPGNWAAFWVALGLVAGFAGLCAWAVR